MKRIVVIGDMHCGNREGLAPKKWRSDELNGKPYEWLLGCWGKFVDKYKNPDILVLNGDTTDGQGGMTKGVELITSDINEQADMVIELIKPIIGPKTTEIHINKGSGYHGAEREGIQSEQLVCEKLGGIWEDSGFRLLIGNKWVSFDHGSGVGIGYLKKRIQQSIKSSHNLPLSDRTNIIIVNHMHKYLILREDSVEAYVSSCWEMPTAFTKKIYPEGLGDIGGLIIEEQDDGRISVYSELYDIPLDVQRALTQPKDTNRKIVSIPTHKVEVAVKQDGRNKYKGKSYEEKYGDARAKELREVRKKQNSNKVWVSKENQKPKLIKSEELPTYITNGWKQGMKG